MEEKLRQAPGSQGQAPKNTLKEEKTTASSSGGGSGYKQEKFVEVRRNDANNMKSEVAQPQPQRGYPAEEKLREIVNPEEQDVKKEEGTGMASNGSSQGASKLDEKKRVETGAKTEAHLKETYKVAPKSPVVSAAPAEQKLREIPQKSASASMKEDAYCPSKGSSSSPNQTKADSPNGQSSAAAELKEVKEEKNDKSSASKAEPSAQKEEKKQEVAKPDPGDGQLPRSPNPGSPSDAAKPNCCTAF